MSLGFIAKDLKFKNELKTIYNPNKKLKEVRSMTCESYVYSVAIST